LAKLLVNFRLHVTKSKDINIVLGWPCNFDVLCALGSIGNLTRGLKCQHPDQQAKRMEVQDHYRLTLHRSKGK
jgi:hypothetical protein